MEDDIQSIVMFNTGAGTPAAADTAQAVTESQPTGESAASPAVVERDEAGKFKAKEQASQAQPDAQQQPEAKPAETAQEKPKGQLAALMAERQKRQQLEQELAQLRASQQSGATQQQETDIFADPQKAVQELVDRQVAPLRQRFFTMSMQSAEGRYGQEFEAAAEQFMVLADVNPNLAQQLKDAEDPGEFVYLVGTNTPQFREAQSKKATEALKAKDAELAALKAELESLKKGQQARDAVPDSLNRQPSGSVPLRESDVEEVGNIVRFKSG